jgi:hypothetical protein
LCSYLNGHWQAHFWSIYQSCRFVPPIFVHVQVWYMYLLMTMIINTALKVG